MGETLRRAHGPAYGRRFGMQVRIARFQNCYGPEGTWTGGREKAPAAICRKVAEATGWRHDRSLGRRQRCPIVHLCRRHGGRHLPPHPLRPDVPTNIGSPEYVTVDELVRTVADVAGKQLRTVHVEGPVGVLSRNFSNERIYSTGWQCPLHASRWHRAHLSLGGSAGPPRNARGRPRRRTQESSPFDPRSHRAATPRIATRYPESARVRSRRANSQS